MTYENDPLESAANVTFGPRDYFGQVQVDAYYCVLIKGQGKMLFDPAVHSADMRRTALDINILPLPGTTRDSRPIHRELIAESAEWSRIVLPSIKALGLPGPKALVGAWVRYQMVPTGRKYTDKSTGAQKDATTIKFVAVYATEAECRAAFDAYQAQPDVAPRSEQQPAGAASNPERAAAYEFLKVIVAQHKSNPAALAATIAANPIISKYFTVDSPETKALLAA